MRETEPLEALGQVGDNRSFYELETLAVGSR